MTPLDAILADADERLPPAPVMPRLVRRPAPKRLPSPEELAASLWLDAGSDNLVSRAAGARAVRLDRAGLADELDAILRLPPGAVVAGVTLLVGKLRGER